MGSQFRGLYRLSNLSAGSYYSGLTGTTGAVAKAKTKLTERLTAIGTAMKAAGYDVGTVDTAIATTTTQYMNWLEKVTTLKDTMEGINVSSGCSTLTLPNVLTYTI